MDPIGYPTCIINVVTGRTTVDIVNVEQAAEIDKEQMESFGKCWSEGFKCIKLYTKAVIRVKLCNCMVLPSECLNCIAKVVGWCFTYVVSRKRFHKSCWCITKVASCFISKVGKLFPKVELF